MAKRSFQKLGKSMGSKYNYVFSNQAKKDFNDIVYYISAQLSNGDAEKNL